MSSHAARRLTLIHADDDPPPPAGGIMKVKIDRIMTEAHLRAAREMTPKTRGLYDIAQGKQAPWRVQCRRLRELVDAGLSEQEIRGIIDGYGQVLALLIDARDRRRGVVRGEREQGRAA